MKIEKFIYTFLYLSIHYFYILYNIYDLNATIIKGAVVRLSLWLCALSEQRERAFKLNSFAGRCFEKDWESQRHGERSCRR